MSVSSRGFEVFEVLIGHMARDELESRMAQLLRYNFQLFLQHRNERFFSFVMICIKGLNLNHMEI